jgi:hypothetical protein
MLLRDHSNWTTAVTNDWKFPVSREWLVLSHIYDLTAAINSGKGSKPKPYPNPFNEAKTKSGKTDLSREEAIGVLQRMNPREN